MNHLDTTIKKYTRLIEGKMNLFRSFANDEEFTLNVGGIVLRIKDKKGSYGIIEEAKENIEDYFDNMPIGYPLTGLKNEYNNLIKKCEEQIN